MKGTTELDGGDLLNEMLYIKVSDGSVYRIRTNTTPSKHTIILEDFILTTVHVFLLKSQQPDHLQTQTMVWSCSSTSKMNSRRAKARTQMVSCPYVTTDCRLHSCLCSVVESRLFYFSKSWFLIFIV